MSKTEPLTEYHLRQSKAAQQVVASWEQPVSLQQARMQVQAIKAQSRSIVKKGQG